MSRNHPSPRSPTAPSSGVPDSRRLGSAFEAMFLDASDVAGGHFDDNWGVADTEQALALSFVDDARLKACIVTASASVWGVPTMRPAQLEACYRLIHPHRPNSLVVVHRTGGGEDSHPTNSRCDRKGGCFDFYPAAHSLGRRDA
jgi:hypothetical protein